MSRAFKVSQRMIVNQMNLGVSGDQVLEVRHVHTYMGTFDSSLFLATDFVPLAAVGTVRARQKPHISSKSERLKI